MTTGHDHLYKCVICEAWFEAKRPRRKCSLCEQDEKEWRLKR